MRKIVVVFFSLLREKNCLISCYCYGYFNRFFVFFALCYLIDIQWNLMICTIPFFYSFWNLPQLNEGSFFRYSIVSEEIRYFLYNFSSFSFFFFGINKKLELIHFLQGWFKKKISFTFIFSLLFIMNKTNTFFYIQSIFT